MGDVLDILWKRGCDFLGTRYALLGGAMTWVSNHTLVGSISNAGCFGVLAAGGMDPLSLREEIKKTQSLTKNPFGVNLILLHPKLSELVEVCIQEKVTHVVLAGGLPSLEILKPLKEAGVRILAFAPTVSIGRKLQKMGVDALIIEGSEAGGHIGPVSTSVLAQEILPAIRDMPIFVAGGIGSGEGIIMYLRMGASGCQLGTRFVCAYESPAHERFKKAFIRAKARDAVASVQLDERFPVIPVRSLVNKASFDFMKAQRDAIEKHEQGVCTLKEAQLMIEHFWVGSLRRAVIEGDVESGSLMAGQSVGFVESEQSVDSIVETLLGQARRFLDV